MAVEDSRNRPPRILSTMARHLPLALLLVASAQLTAAFAPASSLPLVQGRGRAMALRPSMALQSAAAPTAAAVASKAAAAAPLAAAQASMLVRAPAAAARAQTAVQSASLRAHQPLCSRRPCARAAIVRSRACAA